MVGPFPVLLPEGCFPGSVSARWYQAEAFYLAVCCSRSCPEELLLLLLPTDCTVVGTSATEVAALPVPHFPKVLWPSFTEVPDRPVGKGTYQTRKFSLSLIASLALSPRFVTNTLLGLSRPVGKGPGRLPKRSSTTLCRAAKFMWVAEADKLYAFFSPFPTETGVCGDTFHCIHWRKTPRNNIILARNEASQPGQISYHLMLRISHLNGVQTNPSPKLKSDHLQNR